MTLSLSEGSYGTSQELDNTAGRGDQPLEFGQITSWNMAFLKNLMSYPIVAQPATPADSQASPSDPSWHSTRDQSVR